MSAKLLAKMVPHGIAIDGSLRGGQVEISAYDVAASLAYGRLPHPAYLLGRAKYCDDPAAGGQLLSHLEARIQRRIRHNRWREHAGRAERLAQLVIHEGIYGLRCKGCSGLGYIYKQGVAGACPCHVAWCKRCKGSGIGRLSERQRAALAEIPPSSWNRRWKALAEEGVQYVSDLDQRVLRHVSRQFNAA